jgi:colicin import membrane protein
MSLALVVDGSAVTAKALTYPEQARSIQILNRASYEAACEFLKGIKALRTEIAETFDPHIKRAHESHKALLKEKQDAEAPLTEAERITKDALVIFEQAEERKRREEQRRIEAELRRQEEERRLSEAVALEQAGEAAEAEAVLDEPFDVPAVAVAPTTPKVSGISYRETWSANVTDLHALVQHVAAHPELSGLLSANQPALNAQARSLKAQMRLPGVKAVCTRDVAAGRR